MVLIRSISAASCLYICVFEKQKRSGRRSEEQQRAVAVRNNQQRWLVRGDICRIHQSTLEGADKGQKRRPKEGGGMKRADIVHLGCCVLVVSWGAWWSIMGAWSLLTAGWGTKGPYYTLPGVVLLASGLWYIVRLRYRLVYARGGKSQKA